MNNGRVFSTQSAPYNALLRMRMARPAGFEPATYGLEGRCTIRLCYERMGPKYATADRSAQVSNTGIL